MSGYNRYNRMNQGDGFYNRKRKNTEESNYEGS